MLKAINTKVNFGDVFFRLSLILFVFHIVNREFVFLVDFRYLGMLFSIGSIFLNLNKKESILNNFGKLSVLFFYTISLFSIVFLINSSLFVSNLSSITQNIAILYIYCLIFSVNLFLNYKKITFKLVFEIFFISMLLNFIAIIYLLFEINTSDNVNNIVLPFSSIKGFVYGKGHYNFFGQNYRMAGYSEDANFLSINSVILLVFTVKVYKDKMFLKGKYFYIISLFLGVLMLCLSASKAVTIGFIFSVTVVVLIRNRRSINFAYVVPLFIIISVLSIIVFSRLNIGSSMGNRLMLWDNAVKLFKLNPIFGSGISSYRHFSATFNWIVHSHSLYMQVLSELGVIGVLTLTIVYANQFNSIRNWCNKVLILIFIISSLSLDLSYTDYFVFFVVLIPILDKNDANEHTEVTRIAILSNGLSNGGAERMVYDLASELSLDKDFVVDLLLTDPADPNNQLSNQFSLDNVKFNIIQIADKKHSLVKNNFKILNYLVQNKPDVVHTHQITLIYCFLPYLIGSNPAKIHTVHNDSHKEFGSKAFRVIYHILFLFFRIQLVSISKYILQTSIEEYFLLAKSQHTMIYNGRSITLPKKTNEIDNFNIIMVGRLTDVKNHSDAIKMMDIIVNEKNIRNVHLHIFGEGPLKTQLEDEIIQRKLSNNVELRGIVPDVTEHLMESKVFLMTSLHEGFPISAIEALSVGLPLVLSDFGSARELINENGYLVKTHDIEGFASSIIDLYENEEKLAIYGNNSLKMSDNFLLLNMVDQYRKLYQEASKL